MLNCKIITPEGLKFNGPAELVEVKSPIGYMCILKNHIPVVANIPISTMFVKYQDGTKRAAAIGGGILMSNKDEVFIISESFDFVDQIDTIKDKTLIDKYNEIKHKDPNNAKNNLMLEIAINRINAKK